MQQVQLLEGTPEPTIAIKGIVNVARGFPTERYIRPNLIANGDMEINGNWVNYGTPAVNAQSGFVEYTGEYSRNFQPNAANEGIQSDAFTTITGQFCHYTLWVYPDDSTKVSVLVRKGDNSGNLLDESITGLTQDAWNEIKVDTVELAGGPGAFFVVHSGAETSGDWYVDNVFGSVTKIPGSHGGHKASKLFVSVEDYPIRWAVGGTTPTINGVGHEIAKEIEIMIQNFDAIKTFKFINNTQISGTYRILTTVQF